MDANCANESLQQRIRKSKHSSRPFWARSKPTLTIKRDMPNRRRSSNYKGSSKVQHSHYFTRSMGEVLHEDFSDDLSSSKTLVELSDDEDDIAQVFAASQLYDLLSTYWKESNPTGTSECNENPLANELQTRTAGNLLISVIDVKYDVEEVATELLLLQGQETDSLIMEERNQLQGEVAKLKEEIRFLQRHLCLMHVQAKLIKSYFGTLRENLSIHYLN
jgi:hypothetical protein